MPTSKIKMKKLAHYLLAILATAGEILSNPSTRSSCPGGTIEKESLKIEETPVNFKNLTANEEQKQMMMRLTVSEDVRKCMDSKKFNLKINLDQPISEDYVEVGSTATPHIVTVDKNHVGIESCNFDASRISDEYLMLLNVLGLENFGDNEGTLKTQELIFFTATSKLLEFNQHINSIEIEFEDESEKKTCDTYRGRFCKYLMHSLI